MENHPDRNIRLDLDRHIADNIYAYVENGDILGAINCVDREIEIDPDCAYLYAERANFRQRMGDIQGAIVDYDRALDLQPQNQLFKQWRDFAASF
jgi:tetratricopeptide (TPR) repeat protein